MRLEHQVLISNCHHAEIIFQDILKTPTEFIRKETTRRSRVTVVMLSTMIFISNQLEWSVTLLNQEDHHGR